MAKFQVALILAACLALQRANCFPNKLSEIVETDAKKAEISEVSSTIQSTVDTEVTTVVPNFIKNEELAATTTNKIGLSSETDSSSEEIFYLPAQYDTPTYRLQLSNFKLLNEHTNKIISEAHDFLQVSLKAMNALPDKSVGIVANITRMTDLLKRIEKLDLSKNSFTEIEEKSEIIEQLSDLYYNFAYMLHNRVPENDAKVLKELFDKIDLHGYNVRIDDSLAKVVQKITKLVNKFFAKLNEEEKQKYAQLNEWYENFKQPKQDQEKFDDAVVLFNYLLTHRFR